VFGFCYTVHATHQPQPQSNPNPTQPINPNPRDPQPEDVEMLTLEGVRDAVMQQLHAGNIEVRVGWGWGHILNFGNGI